MSTAPEAEQPAAPAGKKGAPGQPWSHQETMHLIDAYEERWMVLRRGQLKAQQWEDVAAEVAARCAAGGGGTGAGAPPKTGTQCRHKIEKLRKRFRAERARPVASLWPYFRRMERLERGPLPISSAFPPTAAAPAPAASDEEEDEDEELPPSNTRSINGILREGGYGSFASRPPPPPMMPPAAPPRKRTAYEAFQAEADAEEEEEDNENEKEEEVEMGSTGRGAMAQLAAVVRSFADGLMRVERRRMEVRREMEQEWMEMESRRAEMLMEAQRRLMDSIAAAFAASAKKTRREHGGGDGL